MWFFPVWLDGKYVSIHSMRAKNQSVIKEFYATFHITWFTNRLPEKSKMYKYYLANKIRDNT